MIITYKNEKIKNLCENSKYKSELEKKFGKDVANKLPKRIAELKAFENLSDVPITPPFRRHKLNGNLDGYFAVNVNMQYRLIFKSVSDGIVVEDLRKITTIKIEEVSKHYE